MHKSTQNQQKMTLKKIFLLHLWFHDNIQATVLLSVTISWICILKSYSGIARCKEVPSAQKL